VGDGQVPEGRTPSHPLRILLASIVVISTVDDEPSEGRVFEWLLRQSDRPPDIGRTTIVLLEMKKKDA
jgi:hypothetical protein